MDWLTLLALAGAGAGSLTAALILLRRRSGRASTRDDVFTLLGTKPADALARVAPPPVDLGQPITTEAQWQAIRAHAGDAAFRNAVDQVRGRYRFAPPMLLSNTLRTTMARSGLSFREAMIEVAKDDGLR
ncbi:MAG TPA: hypothetical protein VD970_16805 [Acetobacteraceae bacterium]|nr:hypothetical protein [Acetobacteraceae bacterium]